MYEQEKEIKVVKNIEWILNKDNFASGFQVLNLLIMV